MKKSFYIITILLSGIILFSLPGQTFKKTPTLSGPIPDKSIEVKGALNYYLKPSFMYMEQSMSISLKFKTLLPQLEIVSVQFNGRKLNNQGSGVFAKFFVNRELVPNQKLRITAAIRNKPLSKTVIIPIGTIKNPNFIHKFIFPKPKSIIKIPEDGQNLVFSWEWTNQTHTAMIIIREYSSQLGDNLFKKTTNKNSIKIPSSIFSKKGLLNHKRYIIDLDSMTEHDFTLSHYVADGSDIGLYSNPRIEFGIQ